MTAITVPPALVAILNAMPAVGIGSESYKVKAVDPPPASSDTAVLPAGYVFTGQATDDEASAGSEQVRETRLYAVQVAVMKTGQGTPEERERRCRPVLVATLAWLRKYPHLGALGVERARVIGDSGVIVLPEFDGANIGFEIRLQVVELIARTYASNE